MAVQVPERAILQRQVDLMRRRAHILGREMLLDMMVIDMHRSVHRRALQFGDTRSAAPWQELRVIFDAIDQIEHLLRAMRNQYRFFHYCHCLLKPENQRLVE